VESFALRNIDLPPRLLSAARPDKRQREEAIEFLSKVNVNSLLLKTEHDLARRQLINIGLASEFVDRVLNISELAFRQSSLPDLVKRRLSEMDGFESVMLICSPKLQGALARIASMGPHIMTAADWLARHVAERCFIWESPCFPPTLALNKITMTANRDNGYSPVPIVAKANTREQGNNFDFHPDILDLDQLPNGRQRWYHGTSRNSADNIVNGGINVFHPLARTDLDFGHTPSFYLSDTFEQAANWALIHFDEPAVVVFELNRSQLLGLNEHKAFASATNEWRDLVRASRGAFQSAIATLADQQWKWILGPICDTQTIPKKLSDRRSWNPVPFTNMIQLALKHQSVCG